MGSFISFYFLPPFLITFLGPGIFLTFFLIKKRRVSFLFFLICAALFGFSFQIVSGFFAGMLAPVLGEKTYVFILMGVLTMGITGWLSIQKKADLLRIQFSAYDGAAILVTLLLLFIVHTHMTTLAAYFNTGTDQYYWLAYAERSLYDPGVALQSIMRGGLHRPAFFLLISPYVAFMEKSISQYQNFMAVWMYFNYALIALALAHLARSVIPYPALGVLAPLLFFSLHWGNYYIISTDVVPQNTGVFLLVVGFIVLREKIPWRWGIGYLLLFYLIHTATFALFILSIGTAKLFYEAIHMAMKAGGKYRMPREWHIFEVVSFGAAVIMIMLYLLYALGALSFYPPELIGYYNEYVKNLTLWDQPYLGPYQNSIIFFALTGLVVAGGAVFLFPRRARVLLALICAFVLPWIFLKTPLIAYHAFYASWQSFRYFLILYPSVAVLALMPLAAILYFLQRFFSYRAGGLVIFSLLVIALPSLLLTIESQQGLVFLDMIQGRDGGVYANDRRAEIDELASIASSLPEKTGSVIVINTAPPHPYVQWAFAPHPVYTTPQGCSAYQCVGYDQFTGDRIELYNESRPALGLMEKSKTDSAARRALQEVFPHQRETNTYIVYY